MAEDLISVPNFITVTVGIIVYFLGTWLNANIPLLRRFSIPEPVAGGLVASLVLLAFYLVSSREIEFELRTRDTMMVYFFTAIGINARMSDLLSGGRPLVMMLVLTLVFIVVQDAVGYGVALAIDEPGVSGLLVGSLSLIGGHGTSIAWAPEVAERHGIENAMEIGIAAATMGLVLAGVVGGPIARFLMKRNNISGPPAATLTIGIPHKRQDTEVITHISIMSVLLVLHVAIILGYLINEVLLGIGFKLPLFVPCLLVAITMSNTLPLLLPRMRWPARTRALAVISDLSLGLFISMSLLSMQLWTIADLAGPLLLLLAAQVAAMALYAIFVVFPLMGRNYLATVLTAGFAGFTLGAVPTAIANMTEITKSHGPAPEAFLIVALVGAFFVDLTNAVVINFFMSL